MIRRMSRYFPNIALTIVFLLLAFQPLYGSSSTCPNIPSAPQVFPRENGAGTVSAGTIKKAAYAPDRIIVKFRDSVTEAADMIHGSGARFAQFTATRGDQLDELNTHFGVTNILPLFHPLGLEKDAGRWQSRAGRKGLFAGAFKQARTRHGQRSARAAKQIELPDLSHIYVVSLAAGTDIVAACRSYSANPNVEYAVPSYAMAPQSVPDDPYFSSVGSWGNSYDDLWGVKKIQTDLAWDTAQGEGVVVAVVDTGLDYNHVDIAPNVWTNTAEASGAPGVDDDGNGYVDDIRGRHFDFVYPGGAVSNNDVMDLDSYGHGTFVAGIIAATGGNGTGIIGVAPAAKIMPVKIMASEGFNVSEAYANGILYAALNGADVINLSWGCSDCSESADNPAVADAIEVARGLGAIVVTSAGNGRSDVKDAFPAGIPDVLTVSSTDDSDVNSAFSNRGFLVDVAAPGGGGWYGGINNSILSLKSGTVGTFNSTVVGGSYLRSSGTSASAAHVSGVAALVLSANPALTTGQVAAVIRQSADDQLGSPLDTPGYDPYFGWGRVNAARAVAMALSPPSDPPLLRVPSEGFSFNIPQSLCGQERSFTFDIFNVGGGALTWSLAPPAWLTPLTSSGSGNASPVVKINASSPASGSISVSSNGAGAGTSDVPVSVAVLPDIKLTNCSMAVAATPGNQEWDQPRNSNPPAVPDGNGGAYYVWYGPDNYYNYRVFIQHVDSNGVPLWAANGVRVSSADKFQYSPTVISDGAGGAIVLWVEGLNTGDYADKNFAAQRISSAGDLLWGSAGIAVTQGGNVVQPVIVPDGSGGAIVGWTHLTGNADDVYAQRISASGALLWQAGGVPLSLADNDQFSLQTAVDGNGGAWFVWIDNRNSFHDVYGQHLDKDGVPLWPQGGIRLNSVVGASEPNVVADGAGGAIVAWYDFRNHPMSGEAYYSSAWDIYAVHLDSAGQQLWSPAETLVVGGTTVTTALSENVTMLSDGKGGAVIFWIDVRNRTTTLKEKKEIFAQRINGAGQPLWSPAGVRVLAADGWGIAPAFIPDSDGGALIAWQDKRFGSFDIFLQQLKTDGSLRWGTTGIWAHSGSNDQVDPYLVPLGGNRLAITWNDWSNFFVSGIDFRGEIVQLCTDHDGDALYAEGGVCGAVNASDPRLTIDRTGPGFGSVQSLPSGINCGADCTRPFAPGSVVTLHATPAPKSFFRGWEGGGCSGTEDCTVTLTADTVVHAIFAANLPVKIAESQATIYDSPQHAYNNALNGNTIISRANSFNETLTLKLPVAVELKGGYDDDFVSNAGSTEIQGLVVLDGSVTVENIVIK